MNNFDNLKRHLMDTIKEEQIKLGYSEETIRLYYPLKALNRLMGAQLDTECMTAHLTGFKDYVKEDFGQLEISEKNGRFCISLPPQACVYVHEHTPNHGFMYEFIDVIAKHDITIEYVLEVFRRYSDHVHFERADHGEFDYLIYFERGVPDNYRYCLTNEGPHMIYHRYTPEEYEALGL